MYNKLAGVFWPALAVIVLASCATVGRHSSPGVLSQFSPHWRLSRHANLRYQDRDPSHPGHDVGPELRTTAAHRQYGIDQILEHPEVKSCSRWITDNKEQLGSLTLLNITLPGTHDSAAFKLNRNIMPGSLPWPLIQFLKAAESLGNTITSDYIINWARSQTDDFDKQLDGGIRYFDLRAGFNGSHWVSCHTVEGIEMKYIFQAFDRFLRNTTHEIIVAQLTHLYNADAAEFHTLSQLLNTTLGPHIAPCCRLDTPLSDYWSINKRLVLVSNVPCDQNAWPWGSFSVDGVWIGCPWWPHHMINNTFADSDSVSTMWFYNKGLLNSYEPSNSSMFKMSWTLTPHVTTYFHGLVGFPSTLIELADTANSLLPDFFDAQIAEGREQFPQILIADHHISSYLVPMTTRMNRIKPCIRSP